MVAVPAQPAAGVIKSKRYGGPEGPEQDPTGGTPEYPVGSVWIAVSSPLRTTTLLIRAGGSRNAVIRKAGTAAIELLEKELQASNKAE